METDQSCELNVSYVRTEGQKISAVRFIMFPGRTTATKFCWSVFVASGFSHQHTLKRNTQSAQSEARIMLSQS